MPPRQASTRNRERPWRQRGTGITIGWMVVVAALCLRWNASATWNFVDLTDFYYGGVSVLDGVDIYASALGSWPSTPTVRRRRLRPLGLIGLSASKVIFTAATPLVYVVSLLAIRRALTPAGPHFPARRRRPGSRARCPHSGPRPDRHHPHGSRAGGSLPHARALPGCPDRARNRNQATRAVFVLYFVLRRDWRGASPFTDRHRRGNRGRGLACSIRLSRAYWLGLRQVRSFRRPGLLAVNQSVRSLVSRSHRARPVGCCGSPSPRPRPWPSRLRSSMRGVAPDRRGTDPGRCDAVAVTHLVDASLGVGRADAHRARPQRRLVSAVAIALFYVAPMWTVPETGPLTAAQLLLAYAYLWVAVGLLLVSAATALGDRRSSPLSRQRMTTTAVTKRPTGTPGSGSPCRHAS